VQNTDHGEPPVSEPDGDSRCGRQTKGRVGAEHHRRIASGGRIEKHPRSASQHNLSARVAATGPRDELRELADTFDDMLARLDAAFRSQRQFVANAGHELRTPLTVMRTAVDVVLAKPAPSTDELIAMGEDVRSAVTRAEDLIHALLTLARTEYGLAQQEQVDLATVAEDALDDADGGAVQSSLAPASVHGDPVLLERLAANLVDNALRYNVPGGNVWVVTAVADGQATLTVSNTGPVVAPDRIAELFQPFRRLERSARDGFGLGLGLAIVASIAAVHQGVVVAVPRDGAASL
jgi:signal transduction histidine kinase